VIDNQQLIKILGNYLFYGGKLPTEKWAFIRRSLSLGIGGGNMLK